MNGRLRLNELPRDDVTELAPRATVILPTASTEQHGPHLPLMTDTAIVEAVATRAAERAAASIPVLLTPVVHFGNSDYHLVYCALSLKSSTFLSVVNDLADSLVSAGFKRIFLLNSHGGNDTCVRLVARDLTTRHDVAVGACSYWHVAEAAAKAAGLDTEPFPGHGGDFETAMMMAIAPELVRVDRFPTKDPDPPNMSNRGVARGLTAVKGGEFKRTGGYSDAPKKASPEWGIALLDAISGAVADAIVAFHKAAY